jgi:hypothetical protein
MNVKLRNLAILVLLAVSLIPIYFLYRYMMRSIRPRQSAARLFIFLLANFLMVLVYTMLLVALVAKLFPLHHVGSSF